MRKKITCFICSLSSGGAEHQLTELCRMLIERDYNVTITTFGDLVDHYACAPGVLRKRLAPNKGKIRKILSIFCYFLRLKTDVVISFGQRESLLSLIPLLFRRKIRVICGERNLTEGRSNREEQLLVKFLYKRADYIVSNSHSQHRNIVSLAPNLSSKVHTIINYLDTNFFAPSSEEIINEPIKIGVFCRYAPQKNCERFVRAVALAKSKGCEFVVDWYGNQSNKNGVRHDYYLKIQSLVTEEGVADCLKLNNHIKNVSDLMVKYDAICLPSLWEGFSNTIAEAISCGKPMLVSSVSDNEVMVKNGVNGFVFDPQDTEQMASAICAFTQLPIEERRLMGEKSRQLALALFADNRFVEQYISLIES